MAPTRLILIFLFAVTAACAQGSTSPSVPELMAVQIDGILLDDDRLPVAGATVNATAYAYEDCGYGTMLNSGSSATDENGGYVMMLTLEVARRQCLLFAASKQLRMPAFPGDTSTSQAFPRWVLECNPPEPCKNSDLAVPVRPGS
jgi:hypothetical protein